MKVDQKHNNIFEPKEIATMLRAAKLRLHQLRAAGDDHDTAHTKLAHGLANSLHRGQVQKVSGEPFANHPHHVGDQFPKVLPFYRQAGYLHDVIEKSNITLDHLRQMGFHAHVIRAVDLLTRKEGQLYLDYIMALSHDPIARAVKLADLKHNMQRDRILPGLTMERRELYVIARAYLESVEEGRIQPGSSIRIFASTQQFLGPRLTAKKDTTRLSQYNTISGAIEHHSTPPFIRHHDFDAAETPAPMPLAS